MGTRIMDENKPKPIRAYLPSFDALRSIMEPCGLVPMTMGFDVLHKQDSYIPPPGKRHVGTIRYYVSCQVIEDDDKHDWSIAFHPGRTEAGEVYFTAICRRCGVRAESVTKVAPHDLPNILAGWRYYAPGLTGAMESEEMPHCRPMEQNEWGQ